MRVRTLRKRTLAMMRNRKPGPLRSWLDGSQWTRRQRKHIAAFRLPPLTCGNPKPLSAELNEMLKACRRAVEDHCGIIGFDLGREPSTTTMTWWDASQCRLMVRRVEPEDIYLPRNNSCTTTQQK